LNKTIIIKLGIVSLIANATYWVFHFFRTYLTPEHKIIHSVNIVGEAHFEAVLMVIQALVMIPTIVYLIKEIWVREEVMQ